MDTRRKILTPEQAVECAKSVTANAVIGSFDVLRAASVARLIAMTRPHATLFSIVLDNPAAVLSLRARAELAAALRVIDYVIPLEADPALLIADLAPGELFHEEEAHGEATRQLIDHVRDRHREPGH